jgi:GrpB-like predicted nucleotidyltransferase (UPF0157 family)
MRKPLSEMTLAELWQLFPIVLAEHRECWNVWYSEEEKALRSLLPDTVRIYHVGSTAVKGIWAKPIVDILIEADASRIETIKTLLEENGYLCMNDDGKRADFNKGYTPDGFADRVFHLHLRIFGDHDELYFRDYLNDHPETAKRYEQLKLSLWKPFEHDRDGYTEGKTSFVREITARAKAQYGKRY